MRVAARRHRGQQLLVEVVAEADRGGADALAARTAPSASETSEGASVTPTFARPSVSSRILRIAPRSSAAPRTSNPFIQPPDRFVCPPGTIDAIAASERRRRVRERRHQPDLVVVRDQRDAVGGSQPAGEERGALLRDVELAPRHRAGAVDHERQVERRARVGAGRGRARDLEHAVDVVLGLHGEQRVFEASGGTHEGETSFLQGAGGAARVGDGAVGSMMRRRSDTNRCSRRSRQVARTSLSLGHLYP